MRFILATAAAGCIVVVYACDGFSEGIEAPVPDSGMTTDGSSGDEDAPADGNVQDLDGGGPDASVDGRAFVAPNCPRPPGPSCANVASCERMALYVPAEAGVEFPWAITSDSKSVYFATMSVQVAGDDPYNGIGASKIVRIRRWSEDATTPVAVLAEGQRRTVAVAVAGDYLYWTAVNGPDAGPEVSQLRRVRRDCTAPCAPESVVSLGAGRVVELVAIDEQTLAARNSNEEVKIIAITANTVSPPTITNAGTYGAIAPTNTEVFVTGGLVPNVQRIASTGAVSTIGTVPDAGDSGLSAGMAPSATDCRFVYGGRGLGQAWKIGIDGGTASYLGSTASNVPFFSFAADQTYVYAGAPNGFGIWAIAINGGASTLLQAGNIFRIAVDDDALYWGDHANNTGGTIWALKK